MPMTMRRKWRRRKKQKKRRIAKFTHKHII